MKKLTDKFTKNAVLVSAICSSLSIGMCTAAPAGIAQMGSNNPASTNQPATTPSNTIPLPEQQQKPITAIAPVEGKFDIKLMNQSNATLTYQVIGDTRPRSLAGQSEVTLNSLEMPLTVTFQRPDGGLLQVQPQLSSEPGVLEVFLKETTDLGIDKNALRIEETGLVFLY